MTPDKNFRLSTSAKRRIGLAKGNKEMKLHLRHMLIDAQLHDEAARRASLKSKDSGGRSKSATSNVAAD